MYKQMTKKEQKRLGEKKVSVSISDLFQLLEHVNNGANRVKPLDMYNFFHGKTTAEIRSAEKYLNLTKSMVIDIIQTGLDQKLPIHRQIVHRELSAVELYDEITSGGRS